MWFFSLKSCDYGGDRRCDISVFMFLVWWDVKFIGMLCGLVMKGLDVWDLVCFCY